MASLMATRPNYFPGLKFLILAGSPDIEQFKFPLIARFHSVGKTDNGVHDTKRIHSLKSLHFAGQSDTVVLLKQSQILASRFDSPEFHEHIQGHCIPTKPHYISILVNFFELLNTQYPPHDAPDGTNSSTMDLIENTNTNTNKNQSHETNMNKRKSTIIDQIIGREISPMQTGRTNIKPEKAIVLLNCTSESNASEQRDEIEALTSIYSDTEINITRPAPLDTTMPSACISVTLTVPSQSTQNRDQLAISSNKWQGELRLILDLPPGYPEDPGSDPRINVEVGKLSMMEFPSGLKSAIERTVVRKVNLSMISSICFANTFAVYDFILLYSNYFNLFNSIQFNSILFYSTSFYCTLIYLIAFSCIFMIL